MTEWPLQDLCTSKIGCVIESLLPTDSQLTISRELLSWQFEAYLKKMTLSHSVSKSQHYRQGINSYSIRDQNDEEVAIVHKTSHVAKNHNASTVSSTVDESIGVGGKAPAEAHNQANSLISHEESSNAELAEENNCFSDLHSDPNLPTPTCDFCTRESGIRGHCSAGGHDYDTWSDNTGGHGYTTDMNKPGDKIQLQLWSYETSQITVAERLEQRKWCGPGQKL
ncbi:hypothetical protein BPAE_0030g00550 [Botrytis paeoniae]|uniref:Uncharacterized protein n=1 Tax=Botrytis paeoniae TaxID=278948 RepID=A0A4Z1FZG4_9HELO|nr:hypothetical protein BPAE_0030g00550 [Botrytis paeoniae]